MAATAVRVLINHQNPTIRRRLRQALISEPDLELFDPGDALVAEDLAARIHTMQPDIVLTQHIDDANGGRRVAAALRDSAHPARVVLIDGHAPIAPPSVLPVDQILPETASRADIVRTIRLVQAPSTYLNYLPAIFGRDEFIGRFLRIFESVLDPVDRQITGLDHYLDPDLAPHRLLPWLASWLDAVIDESWPRERQVALLRAAPELHRWRGTRRGLSEHLRLYVGTEPEIEESAGGLRLGPSTQLGFRTTLGESGARHHFTVTLRVPDPAVLDYTAVCALIEAQKPAHCSYSLVILPRAAGQTSAPAADAGATPAADTAPRATQGYPSPDDPTEAV